MGLAVQSKLEIHHPVSEKSKTLINGMFKNIRTATLNHIGKHGLPLELQKHITQKVCNFENQFKKQKYFHLFFVF